MWEDNGMLASVPGEYLAAGSKGLPDASTATTETAWVVVDTGTTWWHGLVRVRYRRVEHRHGKWRGWSWVAEYAEKVAAGREDPPPA